MVLYSIISISFRKDLPGKTIRLTTKDRPKGISYHDRPIE
ncbi:hypothetical protein PORCAN_1132 [Porphyromonas crevioricanis JCM 13913]|nr:hypothetical protein PORCAN_1132 [Porphyromonas crevioricanis JCM 13913]